MRALLFLAAGVLTLVPRSLPAADPCDGFTWNVAHERALFAGPPQPLAAGSDAASAPRISLDQLYQIALAPQPDVHLPLAPEHKPRGDGTLSGVVGLRISRAGVYRVSLSESAWIDVVHDGAVIASADHQGRVGCSAPHKVVQFSMPVGEVLLQLSGASGPSVRLTVTAVTASPDSAR